MFTDMNDVVLFPSVPHQGHDPLQSRSVTPMSQPAKLGAQCLFWHSLPYHLNFQFQDRTAASVFVYLLLSLCGPFWSISSKRLVEKWLPAKSTYPTETLFSVQFILENGQVSFLAWFHVIYGL